LVYPSFNFNKENRKIMKTIDKIRVAWLFVLFLCGGIGLPQAKAKNVENNGEVVSAAASVEEEGKAVGCTFDIFWTKPDGEQIDLGCVHGAEEAHVRIHCGEEENTWDILVVYNGIVRKRSHLYSESLPIISARKYGSNDEPKPLTVLVECAPDEPFFCTTELTPQKKLRWSCNKCQKNTRWIIRGLQGLVNLGAAVGGTAIGGGGGIAFAAGMVEGGTYNPCTDVELRTTRYLPVSTIKTALYPNPARGAASTLKLQLTQADEVTVEVFNQQGQHQQTVLMGKSLGAGEHKIPVATSNLAPGQYIVSIKSANGLNLTERLVKTQ
jgi:hypothetical protein